MRWYSRVIFRVPSCGCGDIFVGLVPPQWMMVIGGSCGGGFLRRIRSGGVWLVMRVMMVVHGVGRRSATAADSVVASRRGVVPTGGVPRAVGSSWKREKKENKINDWKSKGRKIYSIYVEGCAHDQREQPDVNGMGNENCIYDGPQNRIMDGPS